MHNLYNINLFVLQECGYYWGSLTVKN